MNLAPGGESTIFVNGEAFGTYRADWIGEDHHYMVDNYLTRDAKAGDRYDILMETYAGHYYATAGYGCYTGPVLPEGTQFIDPLKEGARRTLGKCTFGVWNEDAYQLYMDVDTLNKLLQVLDDTSLRASKICDALEQFTLIVDFEQDRETRNASYRAAREAIRPAMEAVNGSSAPVFYAIGNAHLDLAWCWPLAETYRKTARTFAAQLRLLEEYPDYKFIVSQPACYEMVREHYPELFERIKKAAKEGPMKGVVGYTEEKVVSTDFRGQTYTCMYDADACIALTDTFVKLFAWYDNEVGFSNKMLDLTRHIYSVRNA
jgi:alpha-mannosidase